MQYPRPSADGAYNVRCCYKAIHQNGGVGCDPAPQGCHLWEDDYMQGHDSNLRRVRERRVEGWKKGPSYHHCSLAETAVYSFRHPSLTDSAREK
jgi:hypothetical protein